jgi:hypothetical protein
MPDSLKLAKVEICRRLGSADEADLGLPSLDTLGWRKLLSFLDEHGLTLLFRRKFPNASLPDWVNQRLEQNFAENSKRYDSILFQQRKILRAFAAQNIDATLLKGLAIALQAYPDMRDRVQYDLDFFIRPAQLQQAARVCLDSGYQLDKEQTPDHICMVPPETYVWRGNFFDPLIPLKIELHGQLWHDRYYIDLSGLLSEPETIAAQDVRLQPARLLSAVDQFVFLNLHFFRHLFQNQVRLSHLYEMGVFLKDARIWSDAMDRVGERLSARGILLLNLHLVLQLFRLPKQTMPVGADESDLPFPVRTWLRNDAVNDLISRFYGNKNHVLLQMEFSGARRQVLKSALAVHRLPNPARVEYEMQHSTYKNLSVQYIIYTVRKTWEHLRGYFQLLFRRDS